MSPGTNSDWRTATSITSSRGIKWHLFLWPAQSGALGASPFWVGINVSVDMVADSLPLGIGDKKKPNPGRHGRTFGWRQPWLTPTIAPAGSRFGEIPGGCINFATNAA